MPRFILVTLCTVFACTQSNPRPGRVHVRGQVMPVCYLHDCDPNDDQCQSEFIEIYSGGGSSGGMTFGEARRPVPADRAQRGRITCTADGHCQWSAAHDGNIIGFERNDCWYAIRLTQ